MKPIRRANIRALTEAQRLSDTIVPKGASWYRVPAGAWQPASLMPGTSEGSEGVIHRYLVPDEISQTILVGTESGRYTLSLNDSLVQQQADRFVEAAQIANQFAHPQLANQFVHPFSLKPDVVAGFLKGLNPEKWFQDLSGVPNPLLPVWANYGVRVFDGAVGFIQFMQDGSGGAIKQDKQPKIKVQAEEAGGGGGSTSSLVEEILGRLPEGEAESIEGLRENIEGALEDERSRQLLDKYPQLWNAPYTIAALGRDRNELFFEILIRLGELFDLHPEVLENIESLERISRRFLDDKLNIIYATLCKLLDAYPLWRVHHKFFTDFAEAVSSKFDFSLRDNPFLGLQQLLDKNPIVLIHPESVLAITRSAGKFLREDLADLSALLESHPYVWEQHESVAAIAAKGAQDMAVSQSGGMLGALKALLDTHPDVWQKRNSLVAIVPKSMSMSEKAGLGTLNSLTELLREHKYVWERDDILVAIANHSNGPGVFRILKRLLDSYPALWEDPEIINQLVAVCGNRMVLPGFALECLRGFLDYRIKWSTPFVSFSEIEPHAREFVRDFNSAWQVLERYVGSEVRVGLNNFFLNYPQTLKIPEVFLAILEPDHTEARNSMEALRQLLGINLEIMDIPDVLVAAARGAQKRITDSFKKLGELLKDHPELINFPETLVSIIEPAGEWVPEALRIFRAMVAGRKNSGESREAGEPVTEEIEAEELGADEIEKLGAEFAENIKIMAPRFALEVMTKGEKKSIRWALSYLLVELPELMKAPEIVDALIDAGGDFFSEIALMSFHKYLQYRLGEDYQDSQGEDYMENLRAIAMEFAQRFKIFRESVEVVFSENVNAPIKNTGAVTALIQDHPQVIEEPLSLASIVYADYESGVSGTRFVNKFLGSYPRGWEGHDLIALIAQLPASLEGGLDNLDFILNAYPQMWEKRDILRRIILAADGNLEGALLRLRTYLERRIKRFLRRDEELPAELAEAAETYAVLWERLHERLETVSYDRNDLYELLNYYEELIEEPDAVVALLKEWKRGAWVKEVLSHLLQSFPDLRESRIIPAIAKNAEGNAIEALNMLQPFLDCYRGALEIPEFFVALSEAARIFTPQALSILRKLIPLHEGRGGGSELPLDFKDPRIKEILDDYVIRFKALADELYRVREFVESKGYEFILESNQGHFRNLMTSHLELLDSPDVVGNLILAAILASGGKYNDLALKSFNLYLDRLGPKPPPKKLRILGARYALCFSKLMAGLKGVIFSYFSLESLLEKHPEMVMAPESFGTILREIGDRSPGLSSFINNHPAAWEKGHEFIASLAQSQGERFDQVLDGIEELIGEHKFLIDRFDIIQRIAGAAGDDTVHALAIFFKAYLTYQVKQGEMNYEDMVERLGELAEKFIADFTELRKKYDLLLRTSYLTPTQLKAIYAFLKKHPEFLGNYSALHGVASAGGDWLCGTALKAFKKYVEFYHQDGRGSEDWEEYVFATAAIFAGKFWKLRTAIEGTKYDRSHLEGLLATRPKVIEQWRSLASIIKADNRDDADAIEELRLFLLTFPGFWESGHNILVAVADAAGGARIRPAFTQLKDLLSHHPSLEKEMQILDRLVSVAGDLIDMAIPALETFLKNNLDAGLDDEERREASGKLVTEFADGFKETKRRLGGMLGEVNVRRTFGQLISHHPELLGYPRGLEKVIRAGGNVAYFAFEMLDVLLNKEIELIATNELGTRGLGAYLPGTGLVGIAVDILKRGLSKVLGLSETDEDDGSGLGAYLSTFAKRLEACYEDLEPMLGSKDNRKRFRELMLQHPDLFNSPQAARVLARIYKYLRSRRVGQYYWPLVNYLADIGHQVRRLSDRSIENILNGFLALTKYTDFRAGNIRNLNVERRRLDFRTNLLAAINSMLKVHPSKVDEIADIAAAVLIQRWGGPIERTGFIINILQAGPSLEPKVAQLQKLALHEGNALILGGIWSVVNTPLKIKLREALDQYKIEHPDVGVGKRILDLDDEGFGIRGADARNLRFELLGAALRRGGEAAEVLDMPQVKREKTPTARRFAGVFDEVNWGEVGMAASATAAARAEVDSRPVRQIQEKDLEPPPPPSQSPPKVQEIPRFVYLAQELSGVPLVSSGFVPEVERPIVKVIRDVWTEHLEVDRADVIVLPDDDDFELKCLSIRGFSGDPSTVNGFYLRETHEIFIRPSLIRDIERWRIRDMNQASEDQRKRYLLALTIVWHEMTHSYLRWRRPPVTRSTPQHAIEGQRVLEEFAANRLSFIVARLAGARFVGEEGFDRVLAGVTEVRGSIDDKLYEHLDWSLMETYREEGDTDQEVLEKYERDLMRLMQDPAAWHKFREIIITEVDRLE